MLTEEEVIDEISTEMKNMEKCYNVGCESWKESLGDCSFYSYQKLKSKCFGLRTKQQMLETLRENIKKVRGLK